MKWVGSFLLPPLFHLLSKAWCHQFQGTKIPTQVLERKSHFLSFCGKLSECVECLSLLGGCPGLVHRMVNSGLAVPHSIQIRAHLCVPGHCWAWHMLVSKRGLASLSAYDKLCSLLGGASAWVRDGLMWESREYYPGMRDWEWATTTDLLKIEGTEIHVASGSSTWSSTWLLPEALSLPSLLLSFIYKLRCLYTQLFL